ncbi:MAG: hypothetical protein ACOYW7_13375 [Nitrospirota bacterium]
MMEYRTSAILPAPGQLWKNLRSGDILFIFERNGHIEGILSNGKKKEGDALLRMEHGRSGWLCVYPEITESSFCSSNFEVADETYASI